MSEKRSKINLPSTSIPMKANLNFEEPEMLNEWHKRNVYKKIREARTGREKFCMMGHHIKRKYPSRSRCKQSP